MRLLNIIRMNRINFLVVLFIFFLSLFALKDLFKKGMFTSHDGVHQVVRLYYYEKALSEGHFPPRWAGGLLNGYGYPLYIYSYQTPWLMALPFRAAGLDYVDSVKAVFFLSYLFSGLFMFTLLKKFFRMEAAFAGSVIYLILPIRFSAIFVRGAIGDAVVFMFAPILLYFLHNLTVRPQVRDGVFAAFILALLVMSHAMVAIFFAVIFLFYLLLHAVRQANFKLLLITVFVFIFTALISSYYIIPSVNEIDTTKFNATFKGAYLGKSFLNFKNLLYSKWGYGTVDDKASPMSLQLGFVSFLSFITATVYLFYYLIKRKKEKIKGLMTAFWALLVFAFSVFLMLPFSNMVWVFISKFLVVDFSWRVLPVAAFAVGILTAFTVDRSRWRFTAALFFIIIAAVNSRNYMRVNQMFEWPLDFYLKVERTTNTHDEYTPKWINLKKIREDTELLNYKEGIKLISINEYKGHKIGVSVENSIKDEEEIEFNRIYYPGWQAYINGSLSEVDFTRTGLIKVKVDKGISDIILEMKETDSRRLANFMSLSGFLAFFAIIAITGKKKGRIK